MSSLTESLRRRGIMIDEHDLLAAAEDGLDWALSASGHALPEREDAQLSAAGLPDDPGAYARSAGSAVTALAALTASALTVADAATLLGISPGRVRHRIASRELYALPTGRKRLPRWQFDDGHVLPGLPVVLRALPRDLHPLAVLSLLVTVQPELELEGRAMSSIEWLSTSGDPQAVVDLVATTF